MITWGVAYLLGISHAPIPVGWVPASPIFGTSYMHAYNMGKHNLFLHGDQTRCEEDLTESTTNADVWSVCSS